MRTLAKVSIVLWIAFVISMLVAVFYNMGKAQGLQEGDFCTGWDKEKDSYEQSEPEYCIIDGQYVSCEKEHLRCIEMMRLLDIINQLENDTSGWERETPKDDDTYLGA